MDLQLREYELPLKYEFTISRESKRNTRILIAELEHQGHSGYGEGATSTFYGASTAAMKRDIESNRSLIENWNGENPEDLWDLLVQGNWENRFGLCAVDQAAHDLWGKIQGRPVHALWGLNTDKIPPSNYTLGMDTVPVMLAKMQELPDWPVYKIKVGGPDDLAVIRELRRHTRADFRVDANCGWTAEEAIKYSTELKKLDVEFIEQPLPVEDTDGQAGVFRDSALPLIADESCQLQEDVRRCHGLFHGINIKLEKCGGLTPARRMITEARSLGMKVMVGCMVGSTVGMSAIAQLLPLLDYVDMDGALLLARDIAEGIKLEKGYCIYPDRNGNGVNLLDQGDLS